MFGSEETLESLDDLYRRAVRKCIAVRLTGLYPGPKLVSPHEEKIELNLCLTAVWSDLGGPGFRGRRAQAFWRNGTRLSVSVDPTRGIWHDHVTGAGGGVVALVETVLSCSRREAVAWLRQHGHLPEPLATAEKRRAWGLRRAKAERLATDAIHWRSALINVHARNKAAACARWVEASEGGAYEATVHLVKAWAAASARLVELERTVGAALAERFEAELQRDPTATRCLIDCGRKDVEHAVSVTALIVALLAKSQEVLLAVR